MSSNTNHALTKEQLFACLKDDGLIINAIILNRAKGDDGEALKDIGYRYLMKLKDYSKAMAWFQLAANQNDINACTAIGFMYHNGYGVSQDHLTALEYYLRAVRADYILPMSNIAALFLQGNGVLVNKYKALEWSIKSEVKSEEVKKLNQQGVCLTEEDRKKTIYQLINETYDILREERMKLKEENEELKTRESNSSEENQESKKIKSPNEEMENLHKQLQALQIESQQNQQQILDLKHEKELLQQSNQQKTLELEHEKELSKQSSASSEKQLQDKDETIKSLKIAIEALQRLSTFEQTNRELNYKIQEYQRLNQGSISFRDSADHDTASTKNKTDVTKTNKDEENQNKHESAGHYF